MHCILEAEWVCSQEAKGFAVVPVTVERLGRMSLMGIGGGCTLGGGGGFLFGGMSPLKSEREFGYGVLECPRKIFVGFQLRLALQPVCA